jgi:UDP-N-acetylmuramyl tripeptide synthase
MTRSRTKDDKFNDAKTTRRTEAALRAAFNGHNALQAVAIAKEKQQRRGPVTCCICR